LSRTQRFGTTLQYSAESCGIPPYGGERLEMENIGSWVLTLFTAFEGLIVLGIFLYGVYLIVKIVHNVFHLLAGLLCILWVCSIVVRVFLDWHMLGNFDQFKTEFFGVTAGSGALMLFTMEGIWLVISIVSYVIAIGFLALALYNPAGLQALAPKIG